MSASSQLNYDGVAIPENVRIDRKKQDQAEVVKMQINTREATDAGSYAMINLRTKDLCAIQLTLLGDYRVCE